MSLVGRLPLGPTSIVDAGAGEHPTGQHNHRSANTLIQFVPPSHNVPDLHRSERPQRQAPAGEPKWCFVQTYRVATSLCCRVEKMWMPQMTQASTIKFDSWVVGDMTD